MIWRKSWWECRFRALLGGLLAASIVGGGLLLMSHGRDSRGPALYWDSYCEMLVAVVVPTVTLLMAGSGINSQTSWGMFRGFHPSMYFLLSLPISRRHALFVRSAVGAIVTLLFILFTVCTIGFIAPLLGADVPATHVLGSLVFILIGAVGCYGVSTFLTTLFDEFWAATIGFSLVGALFGAGTAIKGTGVMPGFGPLPILAGVQFNRTGEISWPVIIFYVAMGMASMAASVYIVEKKEY